MAVPPNRLAHLIRAPGHSRRHGRHKATPEEKSSTPPPGRHVCLYVTLLGVYLSISGMDKLRSVCNVEPIKCFHPACHA